MEKIFRGVPREVIAERVREKTQRGPDCWEWKGARAAKKYGVLAVGGKNRGAHRLAYALEHGEDSLIDGLCICHHCDNPPCVRPSHLFQATHEENAADSERKGRRAKGAALSSTGKLNPDAVRDIRKRGGGPMEMAKSMIKYGMSYHGIWMALVGKTWRHVK